MNPLLILQAASSIMGFLGKNKEAAAVKAQSEYNAKIIENRGTQALYDGITQASVAEYNRMREVQDQAVDERNLGTQYKQDKADVIASYAARGFAVDGASATDRLVSLAVDKELEFQSLGYRSGKLQANLTQEARLSEFYGQMQLRNSKAEAAQIRMEGSARAKAMKTEAFVGLVKNAGSMLSDYGTGSKTPSSPSSDIENSFTTMLGGGNGDRYSLYKGNSNAILGTRAAGF